MTVSTPEAIAAVLTFITGGSFDPSKDYRMAIVFRVEENPEYGMPEILVRIVLPKPDGPLTLDSDKFIYRTEEGTYYIYPKDHFMLYATNDTSPEGIALLQEGKAPGIYYTENHTQEAPAYSEEFHKSMEFSKTAVNVVSDWSWTTKFIMKDGKFSIE